MNEQTPKSRARKIIKAWMANTNPSATIENDLFQAIADEISAAYEDAAKIAETGDFIPENMPPKIKLIVSRCLEDVAHSIRSRSQGETATEGPKQAPHNS